MAKCMSLPFNTEKEKNQKQDRIYRKVREYE